LRPFLGTTVERRRYWNLAGLAGSFPQTPLAAECLPQFDEIAGCRPVRRGAKCGVVSASEIGQSSIEFVELVLEFIHFSLLGAELIFGIEQGGLALLFLNGQHLQITLQARYLVPQARIGSVLGGPLSVLCLFDLDHQILALRLD